MVKLQILNLQLCQKINSAASFFQMICLSFKNNYLSKKTSKEKVRILKSNIYYVTQDALSFIFSCCSWYVWLTYYRHFTKKGWIAWIKGKMESTVWKFTMKIIVHSIWREYENYMLMPEQTVLGDTGTRRDLYVFALLRFDIVKDNLCIVFFLLVL